MSRRGTHGETIARYWPDTGNSAAGEQVIASSLSPGAGFVGRSGRCSAAHSTRPRRRATLRRDGRICKSASRSIGRPSRLRTGRTTRQITCRRAPRFYHESCRDDAAELTRSLRFDANWRRNDSDGHGSHSSAAPPSARAAPPCPFTFRRNERGGGGGGEQSRERHADTRQPLRYGLGARDRKLVKRAVAEGGRMQVSGVRRVREGNQRRQAIALLAPPRVRPGHASWPGARPDPDDEAPAVPAGTLIDINGLSSFHLHRVARGTEHRRAEPARAVAGLGGSGASNSRCLHDDEKVIAPPPHPPPPSDHRAQWARSAARSARLTRPRNWRERRRAKGEKDSRGRAASGRYQPEFFTGHTRRGGP